MSLPADDLTATVRAHLSPEGWHVFTDDLRTVACTAERVRAALEASRHIAHVVTDYFPRGEEYHRLKLYRAYLSRATAVLPGPGRRRWKRSVR
jgi:hypothetical protein